MVAGFHAAVGVGGLGVLAAIDRIDGVETALSRQKPAALSGEGLKRVVEGGLQDVGGQGHGDWMRVQKTGPSSTMIEDVLFQPV